MIVTDKLKLTRSDTVEQKENPSNSKIGHTFINPAIGWQNWNNYTGSSKHIPSSTSYVIQTIQSDGISENLKNWMYCGNLSKAMGYIPFFGTLVGIARICWALYQQSLIRNKEHTDDDINSDIAKYYNYNGHIDRGIMELSSVMGGYLFWKDYNNLHVWEPKHATIESIQKDLRVQTV